MFGSLIDKRRSSIFDDLFIGLGLDPTLNSGCAVFASIVDAMFIFSNRLVEYNWSSSFYTVTLLSVVQVVFMVS